MSHLAIDSDWPLPRKVFCTGGEGLTQLVRAAIARWNGIRPGLFEYTNAVECNVLVRYNGQTWVDMAPLRGDRRGTVTVHWGQDEPPERGLWMAHELGHALGLGDHVWPGANLAHYINPMVDRGDDPDRYRGVMSYHSHYDEWFSEDDLRMVREHFPLEHRIVLPGV